MQPLGLAGFILPHDFRKVLWVRNVQVVADHGVGFAQAVVAGALIDAERR
ncbi:hypothetical protein [Hymenobacter swuensis]|nr:hypothetical protein [Hymenobacter swuensis]